MRFTTSLKKRVALRKEGEPDDVASLVAYLASDEAKICNRRKYDADRWFGFVCFLKMEDEDVKNEGVR